MSLFRCGPDDEHRWIFNRLHWFVGNVAQILAGKSSCVCNVVRMTDYEAVNEGGAFLSNTRRCLAMGCL